MKAIIKGFLTLSIVSLSLISLESCTKYNLIETGLSNGVHNTSMDGYFSGDEYNWSVTQQLIRKAELESYFNSNAASSQGITFLGITNFSILRYIYQLQETENNNASDEGRTAKEITIDDISKEDARRFILNSIIPQRLLLKDIPSGRPSTSGESVIGTGGMHVTTLGGTKLWLYTFREDYNNVPNSGAVSIYVVSESTSRRVKIASTDIQTETGVVQALPYTFTLGEL